MDSRLAADRDAVSVVIGVIMLIAITVVLAAAVFIVVNKSHDSASRVSHLGFNQDPHNQALTVSKTDPDVWTAIRYSFAPGSDSTCAIRLNGAAPGTAAGGPPVSGIVGNAPGQLIDANDAIQVYGPSIGSGHTCTLQLTHLPINESYGAWTFTF